ncbi:M61 family metallopeptidase [uncultured Deefgea sp.]|uniref:M61 family metallopeptidase n=1 Tax=uncultured Deefgea sp. TaxID=1304914 RepID=UPI00261658F4|nr:PDZ domain-containing protein [uncultured Deefgea sp.]
MSIQYKITPHSIAAHLFAVELTIEQPDAAGQIVHLPSWIPGSYLLREFAKHIVSIEAESAGVRVPLTKLDKSSWQAAAVAAPLRVTYQVYAFDLSVRGAYLDHERGFFNGTSVFLAVAGQEDQVCSLTMVPSQNDTWKVATSLPAQQVDAAGFGQYLAQNYDDLIDHPVEMSDFSQIEFMAAGVPHRMVIAGRHQADLPRLAQDLQKICEYQIQFFGTPAPFKDYLFLTLAVGEGYGGLEHRASTALICNRSDLPRAHEAEVKSGYRQFLGLCSHEYFHSWNVKRIKPAAYAPYDLSQENYSRLLWAFEGITSYYDDLCLLRAGVITEQAYLDLLSQTITSVERGYGRLVQNLEDASFDTWVKYYRPDENSPNALVSYYTKGALFALCLDLTIRQATQQQKSLDDVMRALWQEYGLNFETAGRGIAEAEWEALAQRVTGVDLSALFELGLRSTAPLPLQALLADLDIVWQQRAADSAQDRGGWVAQPAAPKLSLGVKSASDAMGVKLLNVMTAGAAEQAGLAAGDVLVAIDGLRVNASQFDAMLATAAQGADLPVRSLEVHAFRRDVLFSCQVSPQWAALDTIGLQPNPVESQDKLKDRRKWFIG